MRKKLLIAMVLLTLVVGLTTTTACEILQTSESQPSIKLTLIGGAEIGELVTPTIETTDGESVTVTLTKPDGTVVTLTGDYSFVADTLGTYTVTATVKKGDKESVDTKTLIVVGDATEPVIVTGIEDKTTVKGEYNFTADLASIQASDNITATENLEKKIVSVEMEGAFIPVEANVCAFGSAGVYVVKYSVTDENGNSVIATYNLSVKGLYVSSQAEGEVFVTEDYVVPNASVVESEGSVQVTYAFDGETPVTSEEGATLNFEKAGEVKLMYTLTEGENVIDTYEKTVTVKPVVMVFEQRDYMLKKGEEFSIPSYTLSRELEGATVSIKISSQAQEEKAVSVGEKIEVASGLSIIEYTLRKGDYVVTSEISIMCVLENSAILFEDMGNFSGKNASINTDSQYVVYGSSSLKIVLSEKGGANNVPYNGCYSNWANGITFLDSTYNAITFKVYSSQAIRVAFGIGTGGNPESAAFSGTNFTKPYNLETGWNTVTVCFDVDVFVPNNDGWTQADVKQGITYFEIDSVNENYDLGKSVYDCRKEVNATLYVDEVVAVNYELGERYTASFVGGEGTEGEAPAEMQMWAGYSIVLPENTFTNGDKTFLCWFDGEKEYFAGTRYTFKESDVTFTAKWGKVIPEAENTAVSFETFGAGFSATNISTNTNFDYVKDGTLSLKVDLLVTANCTASYARWGKGIVLKDTDYNAITMQVYAETAGLYAFHIGTGGNSGSAAYSGANYTKPYALKAGWNEVQIIFGVNTWSGANASFTPADVREGIVAMGFYAVTSDYKLGVEPQNYIDKTADKTIYIDQVLATTVELPDPELENTAVLEN